MNVHYIVIQTIVTKAVSICCSRLVPVKYKGRIHIYRMYMPSSVCVINPRRACAARVTVLGLSFRLSVCLSVTTFSATTRNKVAERRYQRVQYHTGLILKMAIFVKVLRSKVMA